MGNKCQILEKNKLKRDQMGKLNVSCFSKFADDVILVTCVLQKYNFMCYRC